MSFEGNRIRQRLMGALPLGIALALFLAFGAPLATASSGPNLVFWLPMEPSALTAGETTYFSLDVINDSSVETSGEITVSLHLPVGFTLDHLTGINWSCNKAAFSCSRTGLAAYESITVGIGTPADAGTGSVTVEYTVSGGGMAGSVTDGFTTSIISPYTSVSTDAVTVRYKDQYTLTATTTPSNAIGILQWYVNDTQQIGYATAFSGTAAATVQILTTPGTYKLSARFTPTDPFGMYASWSHTTLVVEPVPLTVTVNSTARAYGQDNPAFTVSYAGFLPGESAADLGGELVFSAPDQGADVGTYSVTASGLTSPYYAITYVPGDLEVTPAPLTISANVTERLYGEDNPSLGAVTGVKNDDPIIATFTTDATAGSDVGTYPIIAGVEDPADRLRNYNVTTIDGALTINPAPLKIQADVVQRLYGETNPSLGSVTGLLDGEPITVEFITDATASSDVDTYPIIAEVEDPNNRLRNYVVTKTNGTLTINKAPLTVKALDATRFYGDGNPTFQGSVTGLVNTDVITGDFTTTANESSKVDTYTITATAIDPDGRLGNYDLTLIHGTLTINKAPLTIQAENASRLYGDGNPTFQGSVTGVKNEEPITGTFSTTATAASNAGDYTITAAANDPNGLLSNYDLTLIHGTLTINPAPLTIQAENATRLYGDGNPTFQGSVTGLVNNDVITGSFTTTADETSKVGTYTITAAANDPHSRLGNYALHLTHGTLAINKTLLTIQAEDASRLYGDGNPTFQGSVTGLRNTDVITGSFTTTAAAGSHVGEYTITAAANDPNDLLDNYDLNLIHGTLTVNKAPLTVEALDAARLYGEANPTFEGTIDGIKNGDPITGTFTTTATLTSDADTYTIEAGVQGPQDLLDNYVVTPTNGTLTINPAPLIIQANVVERFYGEDNPAFEGLVTGLRDFDPITIEFTTEATVGSDVGSYPIVAVSTDLNDRLGNYALTLTAGTLTINPVPLTIQAIDATRLYGQANPDFEGIVTGLKNNDAITGTFRTAALVGSDVDTYTIRAAANDPDDRLGNYVLTLIDGTLTIDPAPLVVRVANASRRVGQENPTFTSQVTGLLPDDGITVVYATEAPRSVVGTYEITATLDDPLNRLDNYVVTIHPGTLTVRSAPAPDPDPTPTPTPTPEPEPQPEPETQPEPESQPEPGTEPAPETQPEPVPAKMSVTINHSVDADTQAQLMAALANGSASDASFVDVPQAALQQAVAQAQASGAPLQILLQPETNAAAEGALIRSEGLALIAQANGEVQVNTSSGIMLLPAPLLQQFAEQNADSDLIILFEDRGALDDAETGELSAGSSLVEVIVATRAADGTITPQHTFTIPLTLTLPLTDSADAELAGIYRFETDADGQIIEVTYVGGQAAADGTSISVERDSLSMYGALVYDREYNDVAADHWAYRQIKVMTARHVIKGVGEDLFHPENTVTRAEFAAMVARAWALRIPAEPTLAFADVATDQWYAATMSAAVEAGLMTPETGNTLRPDQAITRQEMAMVVTRATERFYPQGKLSVVDPDATLAPFSDAAQVSQAAKADMANLVAAGFIKGRSAESLAPNGTTTRAEAATLIWRLLDWGRR